jgi:hypothetical protein
MRDRITFRNAVKNNNNSPVQRVVCDHFPSEMNIRDPGLPQPGQDQLELLLHGAGFGLARTEEWIRSSESEVGRERLDPR